MVYWVVALSLFAQTLGCCRLWRRHARALDIAARMSTSGMVGGALQLAHHHRALALEERLTALQEGRMALEADAAIAAEQARPPAHHPTQRLRTTTVLGMPCICCSLTSETLQESQLILQ